VLEEREALARRGAVDQEADADAAEEDLVAVPRPDHLHASGSRLHPDSFLGHSRSQDFLFVVNDYASPTNLTLYVRVNVIAPAAGAFFKHSIAMYFAVPPVGGNETPHGWKPGGGLIRAARATFPYHFSFRSFGNHDFANAQRTLIVATADSWPAPVIVPHCVTLAMRSPTLQQPSEMRQA